MSAHPNNCANKADVNKFLRLLQPRDRLTVETRGSLGKELLRNFTTLAGTGAALARMQRPYYLVTNRSQDIKEFVKFHQAVVSFATSHQNYLSY